MAKQGPHDIAIRLPDQKKFIKSELLSLADEKGLTLTQVVIFILEDFLRRRKEGEKLRLEL